MIFKFACAVVVIALAAVGTVGVWYSTLNAWNVDHAHFLYALLVALVLIIVVGSANLGSKR